MPITPAELDIMKVLWRRPSSGAGLSATDIAEALAGERDWTIKTVRTLLSRLVEKGALAVSGEGRSFRYAPQITEADFSAREASQFVDRLFDGRAAPLVAQLAEARGLTPDDIAELEALLGRLKS
jgi:predicted transcriptional regulator